MGFSNAKGVSYVGGHLDGQRGKVIYSSVEFTFLDRERRNNHHRRYRSRKSFLDRVIALTSTGWAIEINDVEINFDRCSLFS